MHACLGSWNACMAWQSLDGAGSSERAMMKAGWMIAPIIKYGAHSLSVCVCVRVNIEQLGGGGGGRCIACIGAWSVEDVERCMHACMGDDSHTAHAHAEAVLSGACAHVHGALCALPLSAKGQGAGGGGCIGCAAWARGVTATDACMHGCSACGCGSLTDSGCTCVPTASHPAPLKQTAGIGWSVYFSASEAALSNTYLPSPRSSRVPAKAVTASTVV